MLSRFDQVMRYVVRRRLQRWLAIDNNAERWPTDYRAQLAHTDSELSLRRQRLLANSQKNSRDLHVQLSVRDSDMNARYVQHGRAEAQARDHWGHDTKTSQSPSRTCPRTFEPVATERLQ
jgi:hypothetical protein